MVLVLEKRRKNRHLGLIAVFTGFAVTAAVMIHALMPYLPISAPQDVSHRLWGWKALAAEVAPRLGRKGRIHLVSLRYQEASALHFYLKGKAEPASISTAEGYWRKSQYNLWKAQKPKPGQAILFIAPEKERFDEERALGQLCPGKRKPMQITLKRGKVEIRKYRLYHCPARSKLKESMAQAVKKPKRSAS